MQAATWQKCSKIALVHAGSEVPEVSTFKPGESEAHEALTGQKGFLTPERLKHYDAERNNPTKPQVRPRCMRFCCIQSAIEWHSSRSTPLCLPLPHVTICHSKIGSGGVIDYKG
jgi:hypothetical protein